MVTGVSNIIMSLFIVEISVLIIDMARNIDLDRYLLLVHYIVQNWPSLYLQYVYLV
jgi:hypothetical protein